MGRRFRIYLAGESVFSCKQCGNHLAVAESVLSKDFAYEPDQKYKEGKYILERELVHEQPENKSGLGRPRIDEIPLRELMARV